MLTRTKNIRILFVQGAILSVILLMSTRSVTMPMFSQGSFSKLCTCHIDLQTLFYEVIKHFDCIVIEGNRGQSEQDAAFESGYTKLRYPNGKHNAIPSNAVD